MAGTTRTAAVKKTAGRTAPAAPKARKRAPEVPPELVNFYNAGQEVADDDLDFVSDDADTEEVETEKLFSLDGVEYRIPVEFGPHLAMVFIDSAEDGEWVAVGRVLKTIIGADGWKALVDFEGLKTPQLKAVLGKVMIKVMGALDEAAKNS